MELRHWGISVAMAACLVGGAFAALPLAGANETEEEPSAYEEYAPVVTELEDGTLVQRTPTEGVNFTTLDTSYTYHLPTDNVPYNTYYLKADQRGCNACHADLAELVTSTSYAPGAATDANLPNVGVTAGTAAQTARAPTARAPDCAFARSPAHGLAHSPTSSPTHSLLGRRTFDDRHNLWNGGPACYPNRLRAGF